MISTLALLGFLALIFLLTHRIAITYERHSHKQRQPWQHKLGGRKTEQEKPKSRSEQSEPLVPLRQV